MTLHHQTSEPVLVALRKQIAQIDGQIKASLQLQASLDLWRLIPGVGSQTAMYMLIHGQL